MDDASHVFLGTSPVTPALSPTTAAPTPTVLTPSLTTTLSMSPSILTSSPPDFPVDLSFFQPCPTDSPPYPASDLSLTPSAQNFPSSATMQNLRDVERQSYKRLELIEKEARKDAKNQIPSPNLPRGKKNSASMKRTRLWRELYKKKVEAEVFIKYEICTALDADLKVESEKFTREKLREADLESRLAACTQHENTQQSKTFTIAEPLDEQHPSLHLVLDDHYSDQQYAALPEAGVCTGEMPSEGYFTYLPESVRDMTSVLE